MQTVRPTGPYLLGGYSFGGTVAFEIARQLEMRGQDVALLALLDSLFPGGREAHETALAERSSGTHAHSSISTRTRSHFGQLARLGVRDRINYFRVRAESRVHTAIGRILSPTVKALVCKACLRLHWRLPAFVRTFYILGIYRNALERYAPSPFHGRAVYFKSTTRWRAHQESWSRVTAGGLVVHEVPGDHTTIIRQENARPWAERLAQCIAEAQRAPHADREPEAAGYGSSYRDSPIQ
jgi:thioesterase domain-containing protein